MLRLHCPSVELLTSFTAFSCGGTSSSWLFPKPSAQLVRPIFHFPSRSRLFRRLPRSRRLLLMQGCRALFRDRERVPLGDDGQSDQFLEAVVLVSETALHYNMWKKGFVEEGKGNNPQFPVHSFPYQVKEPKPNASPISHDFLRQFRSPTIFLKIVCHEDLLLPIAVGDFAVTEFIDDSVDSRHEECPNQFQCLEDIVGTFGYEVKMVGITKGVMNSYFAQIFVGKHQEMANKSVEARPSDALSIAKRCKASIFVSKEIVLKDAIKIVHGTWSGRRSKAFYDADLDSAPEGSDPVSGELGLLRKMNTAVMEERYQDAALFRDTLSKLRTPHEI